MSDYSFAKAEGNTDGISRQVAHVASHKVDEIHDKSHVEIEFNLYILTRKTK